MSDKYLYIFYILYGSIEMRKSIFFFSWKKKKKKIQKVELKYNTICVKIFNLFDLFKILL